MVLLAAIPTERVRALIPPAADAGHTAFAHAVLDGWLPGRVFADDARDPRAALICPDNGFFLAVGRSDVGLAHEALTALQADYLERPAEERVLVAVGADWDQALRGILPARTVRKEFRFHPPGEPAGPPPPGYSVEAISERTAGLFGNGIDPWVVRTLGGPRRLAERSFGTVVLADDGSLAAACVACGIGGGEAEIEIGTAPWHRGRGLALVAARGFIAQAGERRLEPAWTCGGDNTASIATARRLGFIFVRDVGVFPVGPRLVRRGDAWRLETEL